MTSTGISRGWRLRTAAAGLLVLMAGATAAAQGVAQETAICFGEVATITGSGNIGGTEGDDVIIGVRFVSGRRTGDAESL